MAALILPHIASCDEFVLADCGMIYVFVCFDCFETKSILQPY